MIRLGLVDDHQIVRNGLKKLLTENNCAITLEANNGLDMISQLENIAKSKLPEIFIVDVNMPLMDGFETVSWLQTNYPEINIIVLSMSDNEDSVLRMIKLGVKSYLTKDISVDILLNAIRMVAEEKFYFPDEITSIIVNRYKWNSISDSSAPKLSELTEREIQFLQLACTEKNYQEIAKEMNVSQRTVDGYRESLFKKLNVSSRVGLALMAIRTKLISI